MNGHSAAQLGMLLLLLLLLPAMASAQVVVYFDDFEAGPGGWVAGGAGDFQHGTVVNPGVPDSPDSGAGNSLRAWGTNLSGLHANANASSTITRTFDASGLSTLSLSWIEWLDSGSPTFDVARVYVNSDLLYTASGSTGFQWQPVVLNLDAYAGLAAVQIRFDFFATITVQRMGWYIDDVKLEGTPGLTGPGADLAIALADGPPAFAGQDKSFTLTLSNPSAFLVQGARVDVLLPAGLEPLLPDSSASQGVLQSFSGTFAWTPGPLAPGGSASLQLVAQSDGLFAGPVSVSATLFGQWTDPAVDLPGNDVALLDTRLAEPEDLSIDGQIDSADLARLLSRLGQTIP